MFKDNALAYKNATTNTIKQELQALLLEYPQAKYLVVGSGIDRDEYRNKVELYAIQNTDGTFSYIGEGGYERDGELLGISVGDLPENASWEYDKDILAGLPEDYFLYNFKELPGVTEVETTAAAYLEFIVNLEELLSVKGK